MDTIDAALLHDIGHEVATLSALVAAVRGEGGFDTAAAERLELVEREIDLLLDLVRGGSVPAGAPDGDLVDLGDLLYDVVTGRDVACPGTVVLCPGPRMLAETDRQGLRRLVSNLVDNAARAAGPSGRVQVELCGRTHPVIRVLDDGPGPTRGPVGSRGMGLAIVRSLADRLGADVTLRPRRGGGAVAEVVLRGRDTRTPRPTGREALA
ncbi:sensor histidine kinase KdpD [Actinomycetospora sp. TBRC 11914]|uniref:sensor histidine kinase n=1 Tax=Actinomycetospora sp. TBRC 11914 TaxID=2729387 RepID=UPI00145D0734|nr:sensor histidine kinase [Actinomycetospora sp. TBRC 11914]NMO92394.1 sensor histidine kinase [Actinomycetospora sp. TBRC 11914]